MTAIDTNHSAHRADCDQKSVHFSTGRNQISKLSQPDLVLPLISLPFSNSTTVASVVWLAGRRVVCRQSGVRNLLAHQKKSSTSAWKQFEREGSYVITRL